MGRTLLEIREFETITDQRRDRSGYGDHSLPEEQFLALESFIREFSSAEGNSDVLDFLTVGYKRNVGTYLSIRNYVGVIRLHHGFQLQILPKIDMDDAEDHIETKRIFLKMIRNMKELPSKVFRESDLDIRKMNIYDLFINMYLQEVRALVKRGLRSSYVAKEENLKVYRGKLLTSAHLHRNFTHAERFYVAYDEFHPNRPENRLIKATLQKLRNISENGKIIHEIGRLLSAFESVETSVNYTDDFSKVVSDRQMKDYERLIRWSKVFLMNRSFSSFSGDASMSSLLFPMESVFESYVANEFKKIMTPAGWEVQTQERGTYLFTEPRPQFALRPDIVARKNGRTIVLDTKWKRLNPEERRNYGITQADMYQMYAYSKKYETSEIWLLYPRQKALDGRQIHFDSGDGTTVRVHMVDLVDTERDLARWREENETV